MQRLIRTSQSWYANKPAAFKLFLWVVVLPTLLAAVYYGLIASDIYVSEARFSVRTSEQGGISGGVLISIFTGTAGESSSEDAAIVAEYILSQDMLTELDKRLDLRKHFSSHNVDFLSRLDICLS